MTREQLLMVIGAISSVLIALFSWTATSQLADLKNQTTTIFNLVVSADKQVGIVSTKVDDLKATTQDLQTRVYKLEQPKVPN